MATKKTEFKIRLQWLMRHMGISQKSLAKSSSLTSETISRWKNKGITPDDKSIQKIAEATGCNFYWLKDDDYKGPVWETERWAFEIGDVTMTPQEVAGFYERIDEIITALEINKPKLIALANLNTYGSNSQSRHFLGNPPGSIIISDIANVTGYSPNWLLTGKGRRLEKKPKRILFQKGESASTTAGNIGGEKATNRNVHLRQIVEWMDAEFDDDDEQALFIYEDLKDRYPKFAEYMKNKRPGIRHIAAPVQDKKL